MSGTVNSLLRWTGLADPQPDPNALYRRIAANPVGTEQVPTIATTADPSYQPPERVGAWNWVQRQRESAETEGLWDPQTGLPTIKGLAAGVRHAAEGVMLGTEAPGIRVYHGSPHSFERFDLSKIGSGEGAQAYGHGLYFAENEGVAKSYKDAGPASSAAFDAINQRLSELAKVMDREAVPGSYRKFRTPEGEAAASEYDALMQKKAGGLGSMYEVNLRADPEHFLDWDKPLSEQSERLRDRIAGRTDWTTPDMTGARLYGELMKRAKGDPAVAAQQLNDMGIPGIRYFDAGSRAAGEGSRNYVAFSDDIIDILRKYGIAGLMLGGTAAAGASQNQ